MAYKFQLGSATMSGSLKQEGSVDITESGVLQVGSSTLADASKNITAAALSGSGNLSVGGTVRMDGVADATAAVASDSFYFLDADNLMKRESMADYASTIAGDGLAASSGVLAVTVDDSSIETNSDALRIKASGVTNAMLAGSIADSKLSQITTSDKVAGSAVELAGTSAFEDSTGLRLKTATAGDGLSMSSQVMALDLNELTDATVAVGADSFAIIDADGNASRKESLADYATAIAGDGLAAASGVLAVGVDDSSIETNSDALRIKASGVTNAMLAGSIADSKLNQITTSDKVAGSAVELAGTSAFEDSTGLRLKAATAGDGLSMSSQVLALDLNELTDATVAVGADSFAFIDATGNVSRKESLADYATAIAGTGLKADAGVLEVRVSGSVVRSGDKIGLTGSIAGEGLAFAGGVDSISGLSVSVDASSIEIFSDSLRVKASGVTNAMLAGSIANAKLVNDSVTVTAGDGLSGGGEVDLGASISLALDISEISDNQVASGDYFAYHDVTDGSSKKDTVDDLATLFAGSGLTANSAVMFLNLNELVDATVNVANDSFAFTDASDTNVTKRESIADLVSAIAGGGLTATSGVLSVQANDVAAIGDANGTLAEGMNYGSTTLSADRTWTLPASPTVGDIIHVKAPSSLGGNVIIISKAGSQTIDGAGTIRLESPDAAVSLMFVAANTWKVY